MKYLVSFYSRLPAVKLVTLRSGSTTAPKARYVASLLNSFLFSICRFNFWEHSSTFKVFYVCSKYPYCILNQWHYAVFQIVSVSGFKLAFWSKVLGQVGGFFLIIDHIRTFLYFLYHCYFTEFFFSHSIPVLI